MPEEKTGPRQIGEGYKVIGKTEQIRKDPLGSGKLYPGPFGKLYDTFEGAQQAQRHYDQMTGDNRVKKIAKMDSLQ